MMKSVQAVHLKQGLLVVTQIQNGPIVEQCLSRIAVGLNGVTKIEEAHGGVDVELNDGERTIRIDRSHVVALEFKLTATSENSTTEEHEP